MVVNRARIESMMEADRFKMLNALNPISENEIANACPSVQIMCPSNRTLIWILML